MVRPIEHDADGVNTGVPDPAGRSRRQVLQLRLAIGLGDPEREVGLLPALQAAGEFLIIEQCLAADQLLAAAQHGYLDVVLVAWDLHRLSRDALAALDSSRIPLVLLAPHPTDPQWQGLRAIVLPTDANADMVLQALRTAVQPAAFRPHPVVPEDRRRPESRTNSQPENRRTASGPTSATAALPTTLSPIVVGSGPGSPGRTTVALNLAAALGAVAPTVLVEADLEGPSLAAYLDADPTRNLALLAHAAPETPKEWDDAIARELQPLGARSPQGVVLCGIPKPELRSTISGRFLTALIAALQARYSYVVVDVGPSLLGPEAEAHRAALAGARQVLLVASSDLVGLWRGRTTLGQLQSHLGLRPEQVGLIINRHDARFHHDREEMEWALGLSTAAVVPYDHRGVQRATASQRPVVLAGRGRAARALLEFAERVHHGKIVLPPDPGAKPRWHWLRWPHWSRRGWPWHIPGGRRAGQRKEANDGAAPLVR